VVGTLNLLQIMHEFNVKKFVFSSTANVYGNNQSPLKENTILNATSPYGNTKSMIKDIAKADNEWSIISLRYFNPIGYHHSTLIGENINNLSTNIMPTILRVANNELPLLKIYGGDYNTKDGTPVRDFIHVMDLACGHQLSLKYIESFNGFIEINLGSGNGITVKELVDTFSAVNSIDVPYEIVGRRVGDIAESYADTGRAKKLLNWDTKYSLKDMCVDSWRWYKQNSKN